MDFELDEPQQVIAASVREVLADASASVGPALAEPGGGPAWQALAKAGMLGLTLPGWMNGDDLGVLEAAVLLTEVGRQASPVPALATIMLGCLPMARWGSRDLQGLVLAGVASGERILTAAVREQSTGTPARPATVAVLSPDGAQGTVTGVKVGVPYATQASWILVPASLAHGGADDRAVVVVEASVAGVSIRSTPASGAAPEGSVQFDAAPIAGVLAASGHRGAAVSGLYQLAAAGAAAQGDGALAGALALTAKYVADREQFGRPLATFQAVAGEAADIYIASRTLHLAALSACWRLSAGLDATEDARTAAYWLATEGPPALRTCHQLHGGIGLDVSYPLHRYSAMISDLVRFVGGAEFQLEQLAEAPCSSS